ncbi:hypothetical protein [Thalassotalea aquiviva]|uniref:hypothetical protein n=1 Tax=Thalassotalea aquiviva TaxID=3242415 RepID=UPI00352B9354
MSLYINLFLSSLRPITFFLPCAAIILGCGLAAFDGVIDGLLFSALLFLSIFAQMIYNLVQDYQRAFISHQVVAKTETSKQARYQTRISMLKLILASYATFVLALLLFVGSAVPSSLIGYSLVALIALIFLLVLRLKTKDTQPEHRLHQVFGYLSHALLFGALPSLLSYHVLTASMNAYIVIFAFISAFLSLLLYMANKVKKIIEGIERQGEYVQISNNKTLRLLLTAQKWTVLLCTLATLLSAYFFYIPILTGLCLLATPSLIASAITLEHFPESDVAQSQTSKISIACFAYWVLFVIGLML